MALEVTIVLKETPTNDDGFLLLMVMRVGREVNCLESEIKSFMEKLTAGVLYPALDRALLINASASWGKSWPFRGLSRQAVNVLPDPCSRHDRHLDKQIKITGS